jgi:hypothetical protein
MNIKRTFLAFAIIAALAGGINLFLDAVEKRKQEHRAQKQKELTLLTELKTTEYRRSRLCLQCSLTIFYARKLAILSFATNV